VSTTSVAAEHNTLTDKQRADGWKLLFDGKKIDGWVLYGGNEPPGPGWVVEDGTLHKLKSQKGRKAGNIMTVDAYENYEFSWDWKLAAGGNNGVKYFITKERNAVVGHEYQMIDDKKVKDAYGQTAAFYLIVKPRADKPMKPMGEWNTSRILVSGNHVEHWLNGEKVLEYGCGSKQIMERVPKTKFKKYPGFGEKVKGYIVLTDHSDPCWFRNIKLRELK
jgi:hypothetical protein